MQPMPEDQDTATEPKQPHVPSKSDFLNVLEQDTGRAGLSLEWMLDRCATREGDT